MGGYVAISGRKDKEELRGEVQERGLEKWSEMVRKWKGTGVRWVECKEAVKLTIVGMEWEEEEGERDIRKGSRRQ